MIPLPLSELERHLRDVSSVAGPDDDWPHGKPRELTYRAGSPNCDRIIFASKLHGLLGFSLNESVALRAAAIFCLYGPIDEANANAVADVATRLAVPLMFVGVLDPLDLTSFLALSARLSGRGVKLTHGGINDRWIDVCHKFAREAFCLKNRRSRKRLCRRATDAHVAKSHRDREATAMSV